MIPLKQESNTRYTLNVKNNNLYVETHNKGRKPKIAGISALIAGIVLAGLASLAYWQNIVDIWMIPVAFAVAFFLTFAVLITKKSLSVSSKHKITTLKWSIKDKEAKDFDSYYSQLGNITQGEFSNSLINLMKAEVEREEMMKKRDFSNKTNYMLDLMIAKLDTVYYGFTESQQREYDPRSANKELA